MCLILLHALVVGPRGFLGIQLVQLALCFRRPLYAWKDTTCHDLLCHSYRSSFSQPLHKMSLRVSCCLDEGFDQAASPPTVSSRHIQVVSLQSSCNPPSQFLKRLLVSSSADLLVSLLRCLPQLLSKLQEVWSFIDQIIDNLPHNPASAPNVIQLLIAESGRPQSSHATSVLLLSNLLLGLALSTGARLLLGAPRALLHVGCFDQCHASSPNADHRRVSLFLCLIPRSIALDCPSRCSVPSLH